MFLFALTSEIPITNDSFLDKLFPSPYDFLATFLAFIVLILIVFFFAYKPVKRLLKKRADYVEGKITDAEKMNSEALENKKISEENISLSKKEAMKIIEDASKDKEKIIKEAKEEALEAANKEYEKKKEAYLADVKKAEAEIKQEMVDIALLASKEILEREVNTKDNERLVEDFIERMKKENDE